MSEFVAQELPSIVHIPLIHPSTCIVSGATSCGKTEFTIKLLQHNMFLDAKGAGYDRVIWAHGNELSPSFVAKLNKIAGPDKLEFHKGFGEITLNPDENNTLVLDDLISEAKDSSYLSDLFTKWSHHANTTVIYLVQNLFEKGKSSVTAAKNAHYTVFFKNPKGVRDIRTLATQLFPAGRAQAFVNLVQKVTDSDWGYLLIDCHPKTPESYKFRTNIFPMQDTELFIYKGINRSSV